MARILEGIRVLDLTRLLPGAICTLMLADLGADIVKVEDPNAGDYARHMPPLIEGSGAFFQASNRNKRSVVIDLKQEAGIAVLHKLVETADVLIEGFRPGVTQRLHVDYDTLKAINPRLIYVSLSGWGQDGPYQKLSGHDLNYVSLFGLQGAMQTPQPLGGQVADVGGAYLGVMGILAALFQRERVGTGEYVDVALAESALPFAFYQIVEALTVGWTNGAGSLSGRMAYYNVYQSSDQQALALAAIEPQFWANFCQAVERPDWIARQNTADQAALKAEVQTLFATQTAQEWDVLLSGADCCFSLVAAPETVPDDPQIQARGVLGVNDKGVLWLRSPLNLASSRNVEQTPAPAQGEHTREVLAAAGYSPDEIQRLLGQGAVGRA